MLESDNSGICRFETTISIDCPPTTLYERWCDLGSWPTFAESLTTTWRPEHDASTSSVPVAGRLFDPLEVNRIPGELLAWRTMDGAAMPYAAEAWLHGDRDGQRTDLQILVSWTRRHDHQDDRAARERQHPESLISEALICFKREMERQ